MSLVRRTKHAISRLPEGVKLTAMAIAALVFFLLGIAIIWAVVMPIPAINNFENRAVAQSTKIYDRTGNIVLYDVHGNVRRTSVPLEAISPSVQKATIAIEDAQFYSHHGVEPKALLRAVLSDILIELHLRSGYTQGGSTITQQVVKNALLTQERTITRKLQEMILAVRLERVYSKDQILSTYLNENPYGGTIYGVQEASQYFFGVDAKDVDLAQAAYLAALPQAPTYYSPYGSHRDRLDSRKNTVLGQMLEHNFITQAEYDEAKAESVQFKDEAEAGIKAPHFVFYVREYLEATYGVDAVNNTGLKVITTLDYDLQQKAEATVAKFAPNMLKQFNASNEGLVAVEPSSGQILAMVGSKGYFDDTIDGKVNVALSLRQPGSSFKPFVYATALEKGYTPDTIVFDLPTQFSTRCSPSDNTNDEPPCYSPSNFDGNFKGPLKLRDAIAISDNVASVKTLYLAGIQDSISTARDMGITTLADAAHYGLTLVLGGGEVNLLELTGAYSVFANDGVRNAPTGILRVEDMHGNVLESYEKNEARVLDPQIARQMNAILSDNVARTPEFGANSPLYFPGYDVADKTGTTNDFRDVWILGYTPGIAVGAWAGNNDNTPMQKKIAAFIIAPMWHDFMVQALEKYPASDFIPAAPETDYESLPAVLRGNWNTDAAQGIHDILYWINKDNPRAGAFGSSRSDSQTSYWDYPVQLWASGQGVGGGQGGASGGDGFQFLTPQQGTPVPKGAAMVITASYPRPQEVTQVSYFFNNYPIGVASQPPYSLTYQPSLSGPATLRAEVHLMNGLQISEIQITIQ